MSSGHSEARTFPAFWPHLKFIGLAFCQKASSSPAELSYDLCQITLSEVRVDEEFYIASYPDVVRLLAEGRYCSVSDHYVRTGFFECSQLRPTSNGPVGKKDELHRPASHGWRVRPLHRNFGAGL
jgi:hypothetical protein